MGRNWLCAAGAVIMILAGADQAAAQVAAQGADLRREAEQIIIDADADDLFEAVDSDTLRIVRHMRSGMTCAFQPGSEARIIIFEQSAPRGDDVGCEETQNGASMALFATRYPPQATLEAVYASTARSLMGWRWAKAPSLLPKEIALPTSPDDSTVRLTLPRRAATYVGKLDGKPSMARIAVAEAPDHWFIVGRFIVPTPPADDEDRDAFLLQGRLTGELVFAASLASVQRTLGGG